MSGPRFSKAFVRDFHPCPFISAAIYPERTRTATWVFGEWPESPLRTFIWHAGRSQGASCGVELRDLYEHVQGADA